MRFIVDLEENSRAYTPVCSGSKSVDQRNAKGYPTWKTECSKHFVSLSREIIYIPQGLDNFIGRAHYSVLEGVGVCLESILNNILKITVANR